MELGGQKGGGGSPTLPLQERKGDLAFPIEAHFTMPAGGRKIFLLAQQQAGPIRKCCNSANEKPLNSLSSDGLSFQAIPLNLLFSL